MDTAYFRHKAVGRLQYDPRKNTKHYEPWWALLMCDPELPKLYAWYLKTYGIDTETNNLWGSHISVIKGQEPKNKELWGKRNIYVDFWHTNIIRWDNNKHAWLDCSSPDMSAIRESLGLTPKCFFHLTIGRLK